jgi:hypothetical protein
MRVSFGLAVLLCACRQPTEIEFDVTTDVQCSHVASTAIAVGGVDDIETASFVSTSKLCDNSSLGSLVVVPGHSSDVVVRIVTGLDGSSPDDCVQHAYTGGCIVARRALSFVSNQKLIVPVTMEQSCRDVACGSGMTCVQGQCVPINVTCASGSCTLPPPSKQKSHWTKMRDSSGAGIEGRGGFACAWTGNKLIVFSGGVYAGWTNDGGIYDPATDTWQLIEPPSSTFLGRKGAASVWTGTDFIVWGGNGNSIDQSDGARFNPATYLDSNSWTLLATPPFPPFDSGVVGSAFAWSPPTNEMIVWGGNFGNDCATSAGAAYNPALGTWRTLANSSLDPEDGASGVWLGTQMLILGGSALGALYDPSANSWSPPFMLPIAARTFSAVAWSGDTSDPVVAWGGEDTAPHFYSDGISFDVTNSQESPLPASMLSPRGNGAGWMADHRFYTWGGADQTNAFNDGAYYDFATATITWTAMPSAIFDDGSVFAPREGHCAVWTGSNAIIWGGSDVDGTQHSDGAIYTP